MLKCNELYHLAPDSGEARPFWQGRARDAQADIQCAMGCGAQLPETPQSAEPPSAPAAATITPTCMNDELVAAQEICARAKTAVVEMFSHVRMGRALELENISALVDDISASIARHPNAFISLARLKSLDDYTYMHSVAVCALMIALGNQLNLPAVLIRRVGMAGLLHDIGKMAIPGAILNKPGRLSGDELQLIRTHPLEGEKTLLATSQMCDMVVDVCLHHHERVDGSGYPISWSATRSVFLREWPPFAMSTMQSPRIVPTTKAGTPRSPSSKCRHGTGISTTRCSARFEVRGYLSGGVYRSVEKWQYRRGDRTTPRLFIDAKD